MIIPMNVVSTSAFDTTYTVSVLVGSSKQNVSLQVDTGSSDLWIASKSCSSSACNQARSTLYDSSSSIPTGQPFQINYVQGLVSGPIVWDSVQVGNYVIDSQALAAADSVDDEPLSDSFLGVLGLALPLNSNIAREIPPVTDSSPDGATFASNLFSMTPSSTAPAARFLSLSLSRPGSDRVPALLGIGMHPPQLVSDPSQVLYQPLIQEPSGAYFWKAAIRGVTVYVDGVAKPVTVRSGTMSPFATAVVDSGMPIILASVDIVNGIYGALGIGPGKDGQYYVPCTTPLNMSVTLDNRPETPLHPLDLTTEANSGVCVGIIQPFPADSTVNEIADMVLGVPFMRSTYTVMAYDQPDAQGKFPNMTASAAIIRPRLGILSLTDPQVALQEFNTVRVLNQPLTPGSNQANGGGGGGGSGTGTSSGGVSEHDGKKLSVGVEVLIGILGFFGLCFILFGIRWAYARRAYYKRHPHTHPSHRTFGLGLGFGGGSSSNGTISSTQERKERQEEAMRQDVAYRLARRSSTSDPYGPSEDTLRALRFEEYKRKQTMGDGSVRDTQHMQDYSEDTAKTRVGSGDVLEDVGDRKSVV